MHEAQGQSTAKYSVLRRRTVLTLALAAGAGAALGRPVTAASATTGVQSLDTAAGPVISLATIGTEPSAVLKRYQNVLSSLPDPRPIFFRTGGGVLKIAAGCTGLADQLQILDAATGAREKSVVPFPGKGGGVGNAALERATGALLAFGADSTVKRVTLSGSITDAYPVAPQTTNASFAVATDSKGRLWSGNYPTGNATRFDPATQATVHTARLRADTQYVQALAVDAADNVFAGTGVQGPAIFTWHTDSPDKVREIRIPEAATKGFVHRLAAHDNLLFVYFDGGDGQLKFRVYNTSTNTWVSVPWAWMPAGLTTASAPQSTDVYAVWNTVGVHKLMRISTKTLEAVLVCLVPGTARAMDVEVSGADTLVNILCGGEGQYRSVKVSVGGQSVLRDVKADFAAETYKVQSLLASASENKVYFGGYTGDGIGSVDISTGTTWRSPLGTGIGQIEGMLEYDASTTYIGSYTGGVIFRFNPQTRTAKKLIELRDPHNQSRPIAWAYAGNRVVAGTIPEYGYTGGALVFLDPANDADIKVVSSPIPGQSILGLVGEGDIVYGTTGVKGGYGSVNDTKPAHVFAWNVAQGRMIWKRALTDEVEINSPILVRGVLYVSTNNGVMRLNKASGSVVAVYRLLARSAPAAYKTSTIAFLPQANSIAHLSGGTVTLLDPYRKTRKEILRGDYTEMVVYKQSRLFFAESGTNVVEVDAVQKPTIRSTADLVSVGPNGWLYVCRSKGDGTFGDPIRAYSEFGGFVRSAHVVDWNGDGTLDVLANRSDGSLQLHRGLPQGGFLPPVVLASTGWDAVSLTVGMWGSTLSVLAADASGSLKAWPVLSSGLLGTPTTIGAGWKGRKMVLMTPSRSTTAALIVNESGSLYRYSRTWGGQVSTTPVRLSSGGFSAMTAFTPVYGHRLGFNGIAWLDALGNVKYTDVASASVGQNLSYPFLLKSHKLAST